MMSHSRRILGSLITATSLFALGASADIVARPNVGGNQYIPDQRIVANEGANQGRTQRTVLKRQKDIEDNSAEIQTLKEEILVIRKSSSEDEVSEDDLDRGCDCAPTKGICDEELFLRLGVNTDSGSCEDLYDAVDGRVSKLGRACARKVRRCGRVARTEEKKGQKEREKTAMKRIRELESEIRKMKLEGDTTVIVESNGQPCATCNQQVVQRGPSDLAILGTALIGGAAQVGSTALNASAYKYGQGRYYDAYTNNVNQHYAFQNNAANQYYAQVPGMINQYTQLGMPYNLQQYQSGGGALAGPMTPSAGILGGGYLGLGGQTGLGGYGTGGYGYPYGGGVNLGLGGQTGLGYGSPYGLGNYGTNIGLNAGAYPYGIGANAGYVPYMNGMGLLNGGGLGLNGGLYGNNGYGNTGYGYGGYNGGQNAAYQLQQQRTQMAYQNSGIANQQLQEVYNRYQQTQSMGYGMGGYGSYGGATQGGYGLGVNLGIGLNGNFGFGGGYY